jgi:hypothetical protein
MSLLKKRTMTPARLAANRANARRSRGATTREGIERIRAAKLRHGFYSKKAGQALEALGEDSGELAGKLAAIKEAYRPRNSDEARWVDQMGRAFWRADRAGKLQSELMDTMSLEATRPSLQNQENPAFDEGLWNLLLRMETSACREFYRIGKLLAASRRLPH